MSINISARVYLFKVNNRNNSASIVNFEHVITRNQRTIPTTEKKYATNLIAEKSMEPTKWRKIVILSKVFIKTANTNSAKLTGEVFGNTNF